MLLPNALRQSGWQRQQNYRLLFLVHVRQELTEVIRQSTNSGMAIGCDRFKEEIELLTGKKVTAKKSGRPKKYST